MNRKCHVTIPNVHINYHWIHKPKSGSSYRGQVIHPRPQTPHGDSVVTPETPLLVILSLVCITDQDTVYPKKYAHGFCFAVLCCGYTLTDFPISIRLTSLALWQSNDCPSVSKATLMNMAKYFMWIHYERLHNHNKAKHTKTVCIFLGIYCKREVYGNMSDPFFEKKFVDRNIPGRLNAEALCHTLIISY